MLAIFALIIATDLGTQIIAAIALIFLFRKMTQYICHLQDKVDKKAEAEATKGWGDW